MCCNVCQMLCLLCDVMFFDSYCTFRILNMISKTVKDFSALVQSQVVTWKSLDFRHSLNTRLAQGRSLLQSTWRDDSNATPGKQHLARRRCRKNSWDPADVSDSLWIWLWPLMPKGRWRDVKDQRTQKCFLFSSTSECQDTSEHMRHIVMDAGRPSKGCGGIIKDKLLRCSRNTALTLG